MILITGASGTIGSAVVRQLVAQGIAVRAMTRRPDVARQTAGVDVVQGDFEQAESVEKAVDGVEAVFLLSAPGSRVPAHDQALVRAAVRGGVRKVVKLSAIGSSADGLPANWHVAGEQAVRESGLEWVILRPTGFASNALRWVSAVRAGESVPNVTGAGVHAFVDPRDVAAVAVEALVSERLNSRVLTLTGPELLSVPEQVAQLTAVLGREIGVVEVPLEVAGEQLRAAGVDEAVVEVALRGAELIRSGGEITRTDEVEKVLGRPAGTFRSWAEDHRSAF
jgi:uncharacterized protein YbjT (DUF2867 family)